VNEPPHLGHTLQPENNYPEKAQALKAAGFSE
jgi:hypothetical protein